VLTEQTISLISFMSHSTYGVSVTKGNGRSHWWGFPNHLRRMRCGVDSLGGLVPEEWEGGKNCFGAKGIQKTAAEKEVRHSKCQLGSP